MTKRGLVGEHRRHTRNDHESDTQPLHCVDGLAARDEPADLRHAQADAQHHGQHQVLGGKQDNEEENRRSEVENQQPSRLNEVLQMALASRNDRSVRYIGG
jgi:hypothetical protein